MSEYIVNENAPLTIDIPPKFKCKIHGIMDDVVYFNSDINDNFCVLCIKHKLKELGVEVCEVIEGEGDL